MEKPESKFPIEITLNDDGTRVLGRQPSGEPKQPRILDESKENPVVSKREQTGIVEVVGEEVKPPDKDPERKPPEDKSGGKPMDGAELDEKRPVLDVPMQKELQEGFAYYQWFQNFMEEAQKQIQRRNDPKQKDGAPIPEAAKGKATASQDREAAAKALEQIEKKLVDLKLTNIQSMELKARDLKSGLGPAYLETAAWDPKGNGKLDCAIEMSGQDWDMVMALNKVLYGFMVRGDEKEIKGVSKARSAAFTLVPPPKMNNDHLGTKDEPGLDATNDGLAGLIQQLLMKSPEMPKPIPKPAPQLPKPEFEIYDTSSISITEVKNQLQWSLAENGFSSSSISGAIEAPVYGLKVGVSAALTSEKFKGNASATSQGDKEYFATYNFPRVRMFLDQLNLALSTACKEALAIFLPEHGEGTQVRRKATFEDLQHFSQRFGHLFATRVQLGGQLRTTKTASANENANDTAFRQGVKDSIALSFASPSGGALAGKSVSEQQENRLTGMYKLVEKTSIAWTARGGDTLLCANPPLWAGSVATFRNWRVIEQEEVTPIHQLIGKFKGYESIPEIFESILQDKLLEWESKPSVSGQVRKLDPDLEWAGQLCLSIGQRYLVVDVTSKGQEIRLSSPAASPPSHARMVAFNADEKHPTKLSALRPDWPLYIRPGGSQEPEKNAGLYTAQVDVSSGDNIAITRDFLMPTQSDGRKLKVKSRGEPSQQVSFRKKDASGDWQGVKAGELVNGDEVTLWVHQSPWVNSDHKPENPSVVMMRKAPKSDIDLRVGGNAQETNDLANTGYTNALFQVEYLPSV